MCILLIKVCDHRILRGIYILYVHVYAVKAEIG